MKVKNIKPKTLERQREHENGFFNWLNELDVANISLQLIL
jgi:hypothetical protein